MKPGCPWAAWKGSVGAIFSVRAFGLEGADAPQGPLRRMHRWILCVKFTCCHLWVLSTLKPVTRCEMMFCIENQKLPRHSLVSAPGLKIASQTTRVEVLRSGFLEVTGRISTESPSPCSSERLGLLRAVHVCLTTNKVISQHGSLFRLRRVGLWLTFWWEGLRAGPFIRKCALLRGLSVR